MNATFCDISRRWPQVLLARRASAPSRRSCCSGSLSACLPLVQPLRAHGRFKSQSSLRKKANDMGEEIRAWKVEKQSPTDRSPEGATDLSPGRKAWALGQHHQAPKGRPTLAQAGRPGHSARPAVSPKHIVHPISNCADAAGPGIHLENSSFDDVPPDCECTV